MTPAEMAKMDPAYWAQLYGVKLQSGPFSFTDRMYQLEPMQSTAKRKCYMKGTQLGITEIEVLSSLHGMIQGRYPLGVLYLFPTTDNVLDFSKSRFKPLITANKELIGQYVKTSGRGTDTTSLKKVRNAFLYLRGARLTHSMGSGDKAESVQLRSIPVDRVVFDELDLMDEDVVMKARGRMAASRIGEEVFLSNPTLPGFGIDRLFQESDQRHWHRRCGCGEWGCPELTFPECVQLGKNGRGRIVCHKCGKDIPRDAVGEWVPAKPENTENMHGYRMSHLMSAFIDPADVLRDYREPPNGNMGDVYRLRLGLPYVAVEDKLTEAVVLNCCADRLQPSSHGGPCAMGVDVGKVKHVVIGVRSGDDRYEIIRTLRVKDWEDLHELAERYGVRSTVVDARPYEDEARQFQKSQRHRVFLCEYNESSIADVDYNERTGLVKANRTQAFDATHRLFSSGDVVLPRLCEEVKEFARQCCATAKVLETNKRTGTPVYRYRKLGDEHYRNAMNYFMLAASGGKIARVNSIRGRRLRMAVSEYQMI